MENQANTTKQPTQFRKPHEIVSNFIKAPLEEPTESNLNAVEELALQSNLIPAYLWLINYFHDDKNKVKTKFFLEQAKRVIVSLSEKEQAAVKSYLLKLNSVDESLASKLLLFHCQRLAPSDGLLVLNKSEMTLYWPEQNPFAELECLINFRKSGMYANIIKERYLLSQLITLAKKHNDIDACLMIAEHHPDEEEGNKFSKKAQRIQKRQTWANKRAYQGHHFFEELERKPTYKKIKKQLAKDRAYEEEKKVTKVHPAVGMFGPPVFDTLGSLPDLLSTGLNRAPKG